MVVTRKTRLEEQAERIPLLCGLQKAECGYEERRIPAADYLGKCKSFERCLVVQRVGFAVWLLAGAGG